MAHNRVLVRGIFIAGLESGTRANPPYQKKVQHQSSVAKSTSKVREEGRNSITSRARQPEVLPRSLVYPLQIAARTNTGMPHSLGASPSSLIGFGYGCLVAWRIAFGMTNLVNELIRLICCTFRWPESKSCGTALSTMRKCRGIYRTDQHTSFTLRGSPRGHDEQEIGREPGENKT